MALFKISRGNIKGLPKTYEVINYLDRIIGTVSCVPEYKECGGGEEIADRDPVKVNRRIWIKVV